MSFEKLSTWVLFWNKFATHRSIVSCKGSLVKSDSVSKLAITSFESKLWSSSVNVKESLIVYSLVVRGSSNGTKNFASLYVSVPMADKLVLKDGRPSVADFERMKDWVSQPWSHPVVMNLGPLNWESSP